MKLSLTLCLIAVGSVLGNDNEEQEKKVKKDFPNLSRIYTKLALFSRITSSLKLERELSQNEARNAALSELLGIGSPDVFTALDNLVLEPTKSNIASWSSMSSGFGTSPLLSEDQTIDGLKALRDLVSMKGLTEFNAQEMTSKAAYYYDSLGTVASRSYDAIVMIQAAPIIHLKDALSYIANASKAETVADKFFAKHAAMNIPKYIREFLEFSELVKQYDTTMKFLYDDVDLTKYLKPLEAAKKASERYASSWVQTLPSDFNGIIRDLKLFKAFEDDRPRYEQLVVMLRKVGEVARKLMLPLKKRAVTAGLLGGFNGLQTVLNQTEKSDWVKEELANNKKSNVDILLGQLKPLQTFAQRVSKVKEVHPKLLDMLPKADFLRLANMFSNTLKLFDGMSPKRESVLSMTAECLKDMSSPSQAVDFPKFDDGYRLTEYIEKTTERMKEMFIGINKLPIMNDYKHIEKIVSSVNPSAETLGLNMPDEVAWDNINLIKNMEKNEEYIEVLRVGIEKFSELQNSGLLDILKGRLDMSEMKYVKSSVNNLFDGTGLFQALNCLSGKSSLEDLTTGIDGISTFLEIAKGLRRIAAYKNVTDSVIPKIIDTMIELKEAVKSLSNPANGNRTRREAKPTIELPADSVDSLSQGAELFEKLLAIAAKKEEFMQISKFEKKVNQEIALIRMPPMYSLWTDSMRAKFNHMLQEISDLEKLAAKFTKPSESVSAISALFERADKIVGVPNFDTSLFASPMATTLRASNDSDIQAAGNALHNLRDIELQYSSGHFKSAEEAAKSLRDYFKIFFDPSMAPIIQGGQPRILPGALSAATTPSAEQDNGFDALFFIVIGCVLCVIVIIILLIVCIIRLKGRGAKKEPEGVWRHLRFLEEGILLPHFGIEYTPMHLAIVDRRTDDVKKRIKNGAYVNVHSIGKVRETPLHTAVTLDFAEIVTLLLKNGADPNAKDQNYESPKDRAKNNRAEIQKIFQDFEKKTFPMVWPKELSAEKYRVFIEPELRKTLEAAPSLQENIVEKYEEATHFVVKNKTDEILDLDLIKEQEGDNGLASLLVQIFSPRLIMTSTWLEEGALRSTDFQNDYKFRVKKVRFQGEEYKTLYKIHEEFHKMEIPYLCNATVFFYQASLHTLDWKYYKRIATYLGATVTEVFPFVEEATRQHQHLYYREDVGNTLVIYMEEHAVELDAKHGPLRSQKSYAFMELNEFIAFLLLHKTVGSKSAVSTAKSKRKGESREAAKDVSMTQDVSSSHDNLSKTGEP